MKYQYCLPGFYSCIRATPKMAHGYTIYNKPPLEIVFINMKK